MAEKKEAPKKIVSPKGVAKFPALSAADMKFAKNGIGTFHVELLLPADDAATTEFCNTLQKLAEEAYEEHKAALKGPKAKTVMLHVPFKDDYDKEGEPTGNIAVSFKSSSHYADKKTGELIEKKLPLFDSKGTLIETKVNVGGGSVIKVSFTPFGFYNATGQGMAGISLRMNAVQVIKLKTWGGASAADHGFGAEESDDAFTAEKPQTFEDQTPDENGGDY
jgi:hypothetical protein